MIPKNSTLRWAFAGTARYEKSIAKTNRLSSERLRSSTKPVRYSEAAVPPRHGRRISAKASATSVQTTLQIAEARIDGTAPAVRRSSTRSSASMADDRCPEGQPDDWVHHGKFLRRSVSAIEGLPRPLPRAGAPGLAAVLTTRRAWGTPLPGATLRARRQGKVIR